MNLPYFRNVQGLLRLVVYEAMVKVMLVIQMNLTVN